MKHTLKDILVLIISIISIFTCISIAIPIVVFAIKLIISTISLLLSLAILIALVALILFIVAFVKTYLDETKKPKDVIKF